MQTRRRRKTAYALSGITLAATLLVLCAHAFGLFQRLEWITYDARMHMTRADKTLPSDIAVILIDETSLQAMNPIVGRFPWPRSVYADLLEFLSYGDPKSVVFDIFFGERDAAPGTSADTLSNEDQAFAQAAAGSGNVYQAMQIMKDKPDPANGTLLNRPLPAAFVAQHALRGARGFRDRGNNTYMLPLPALSQTAKGVGVVSWNPDDDGVYRRARLFFPYQSGVYPALSIAPLLNAPKLQPMVQHPDSIDLGKLHVPLDEDGRMRVNYYGNVPAYSISGIFSSLQKIRSGDIQNLIVNPDEFRNKIVFIGASAVGLQDLKATPMDRRTPGTLMHASVAGNILTGDLLRPAPESWTIAAVVILCLLTGAVLLLTRRTSLQIAVPLALACAYGGWCYWEFARDLDVEMVSPLVGLGLTWFASVFFMLITEGVDKNRVRRMFAQYLSPAVLSEVVDRYEDQLEGKVGRNETVSILFSDIRGFTTLSETQPPDKVVEILNRYFSVMTEVIFEQQGTLDKFIGDAIMAFWGAPLKADDHAQRAVAAAVGMTRALPPLNEELKAAGAPALGMGVGINTGEVILGNIGSARKLDYTVIGDNVNLASRVEGLTAKYGCPVVISEATRQALGPEWPCGVIDLVRVKGKQVPVRMYRPLALPSDATDALKAARHMDELSETAFQAYLAKDWDRAERSYRALGEDDPIGRMYLDRIAIYREQAPPANWDGVHIFETK